MNLQPVLENEIVKLVPLKESDFEALYQVASDPLIWEQHPNKNRYQREVFQNFFDGAMESQGAFIIIDKKSNQVIGSTRFYDLNASEKSVLIGYTFYGRDFWGSTYNPSVKKLMLDYAFEFVDDVYFHIGAGNIRSQKAIERLGAKKVREMEVAYHGEPEKLNFEYAIKKKDWKSMETNFEIVKATITDVNDLADISRKTFIEAFAKDNTAANMQLYLDANITAEKMTTEMNDPDSEFYLAKNDSEVVGYLKVNFGKAQTELQDKNALEIERIYVSKDYYGKNLGQLLFSKAIAIAKANGLKNIWLGVWEKNERAINFYKKNGFTTFGNHSFVLGEDIQTDILMRLEL